MYNFFKSKIKFKKMMLEKGNSHRFSKLLFCICLIMFLVGAIVLIVTNRSTYAVVTLDGHYCQPNDNIFNYEHIYWCCPAGTDYYNMDYCRYSYQEQSEGEQFCGNYSDVIYNKTYVKDENGNLVWDSDTNDYKVDFYSCLVPSKPAYDDNDYDNSDVICYAGEYYSGQGKCSTCPANYYCPGGAFSSQDSSRDGVFECPNGSTSLPGSSSQSDCSIVACVPGTYYSGQGKCIGCPANYYCPGGTFSAQDSSSDGVFECPNGTTSLPGSSSQSDCSTVVCVPGTYYSGQGKCTGCPANYYCPGGTFSANDSSGDGVFECPKGTTSPPGADSEMYCEVSGGNNGGNVSSGEESKIEYNINYNLNGGLASGNPTSATKDEIITINHPTKDVTVYCNDNDSDAIIGDNPTVEFEFRGWTSNNVDTNNAYYGNTLWSDGTTFVTDTKFKNLSITNGATVTLEANWEDASVELPSVTKEGYTCNWNTMTDGKGDSYESGDEYNLSGNSSDSVNLYAICEINSKTDEEIKDPDDIQTGDVLILVVWAIGLGTLGYSVYYFMKRRNSL